MADPPPPNQEPRSSDSKPSATGSPHPNDPSLPRTPTSRYRYLCADDLEEVEQYREGGYHPVSLGDTFVDGRYSVTHKLGCGGYSTVWLARDQKLERWVSLKILSADEHANFKEHEMFEIVQENTATQPGSRYIVELLDSFTISGPNGQHTCLVSEVLGPSVSQIVDDYRYSFGRAMMRPDRARDYARQIIEAVATLHALGIVHGDITTPNVLFKLTDFETWTEEEVMDRLGEPQTREVLLADGTQPTDGRAPPYLVHPVQFAKLHPELLSKEIRLIDLGVSFFVDNPPDDGTGTPLSFASPELVIANEVGIATDAWAVACTIYELCVGRPLFQSVYGSVSSFISSQVWLLGKLPEPIWNKWETRAEYYEEDGTHKHRKGKGSLKRKLQSISATEDDVETCIRTRGNEIQVLDDMMLRCGQSYSEEDCDGLYEVLEPLLRIDPKDRAPVESVLGHPWLVESEDQADDSMRVDADDGQSPEPADRQHATPPLIGGPETLPINRSRHERQSTEPPFEDVDILRIKDSHTQRTHATEGAIQKQLQESKTASAEQLHHQRRPLSPSKRTRDGEIIQRSGSNSSAIETTTTDVPTAEAIPASSRSIVTSPAVGPVTIDAPNVDQQSPSAHLNTQQPGQIPAHNQSLPPTEPMESEEPEESITVIFVRTFALVVFITVTLGCGLILVFSAWRSELQKAMQDKEKKDEKPGWVPESPRKRKKTARSGCIVA